MTTHRTSTLDEGSGGGDGFLRHPHLFLLFEAARPLEPSARWSLAGVEECRIGRNDRERVSRYYWENPSSHRLDVRLPDKWISSAHARLVRTTDGWLLEDLGSKNGTRVNGVPQVRATLQDGDVIEIGQAFFLFRLFLPIRPKDPPEVVADRLTPPAPGLATLIPTLAKTFEDLANVARSTITIFIGGESGTGKEVVARAAHALSGRRGPFLPVNCGAFPPNLVESELFGFRKGAFSGAVEDRPGLIRAAEGGTLFLDEIGDLPPNVQVSLLRAVQEREVIPIGASQPVHVDVRLVAATHHHLPALVAQGRFRADLFARISVSQFALPPLRQRREDLGLVIGALLRAHAARRSVAFEVGAARALVYYPWPLNVRELENCLLAALAFAPDRPISLRDLPPDVRIAGEAPASPPERKPENDDAQRRELLVALMSQHGGNMAEVGRALGKDRKQIQRWIKKYGLDPDSFRRR